MAAWRRRRRDAAGRIRFAAFPVLKEGYSTANDVDRKNEGTGLAGNATSAIMYDAFPVSEGTSRIGNGASPLSNGINLKEDVIKAKILPHSLWEME